MVRFFFLVLSSIVVLVHPLKPDSKPCPKSLSISLKNPIKLENGSLLHENVTYPANLWWSEEDRTYGCICNVTSCIRRCCKRGEGIGTARSSCSEVRRSDGPDVTRIKLFEDELVEELKETPMVEDAFHTLENSKSCPDESHVRILLDRELPKFRFVLQRNGSIVVADKILDQSMYCFVWSRSLEYVSVLACAKDKSDSRHVAYPIGMAVSVVFILITLFVYAVLPELRNRQGKILMFYLSTIVVGYGIVVLFFAIHQGIVPVIMPLSVCVALGIWLTLLLPNDDNALQ